MSGAHLEQLVGFARVDLEPGATKTVTFVVPLSVLAYTGASGNLTMEPGPVELSAGSSSSDIRSTATFIVTGTTRIFKSEGSRVLFRGDCRLAHRFGADDGRPVAQPIAAAAALAMQDAQDRLHTVR